MKKLVGEEAERWQKKIPNHIDARPLVFAKADEIDSPFVLEVTNGQGPLGTKTLVIQITKRADANKQRALLVVRHALADVFGADAGKVADCDYRDVAELRKRLGKEMINEAHDHLTVVFDGGVVPAIRHRDWVRDQLAAALRRWWGESAGW